MIISAEAILKSKSGRSLIDPKTSVTAENVEEFYPSEETVAQAERRFRQLGFTVKVSGVTLTIQGEQTLFERVFKSKLFAEKNARTGSVTVRTESDAIVPKELEGLVEGVVFMPAPELF